jgi:hypothetical protein
MLQAVGGLVKVQNLQANCKENHTGDGLQVAGRLVAPKAQVLGRTTVVTSAAVIGVGVAGHLQVMLQAGFAVDESLPN